MTDAELCLWKAIRKKQINEVQFYRQKPLGNYIVDFYGPAKKIVIEIDGGQHFEDEIRMYDKKRSKFLQKNLGLKVLRYSNLDVLKNLDAVIENIYQLTK